MDKKIKHRINEGDTVQVPNIKSNINFESSYRELPHNELSELVNAYEVFSDERNDSDKYRVISTIRLMASNALPNITGNDSLADLDSTRFRNLNPVDDNDVTDVTDLTFEESYKTYFGETDGWYSYPNPAVSVVNKCSLIDFSPKRDEFEIVNDEDTNWYFYLTYPESVDDTHYLINGGVLLVDSSTANVGGIDRQILVSPIKHNLVAGDKVRISNAGSHNGDYSVIRQGYDNGNLREYAFVIDLPADSISTGANTEVRMKKVYLGEESIYYFRRFKKITEANDYEVYNLAYSQNIYGDKVSQLVFNGGSGTSIDVQVGSLTDNLGRPLSELYVTAVKGQTTKSGTPNFSKLTSGLLMPFIGGLENHPLVPDVRRLHNVTTHETETHDEIESDIVFEDDAFYGDVVEYNRLYLKEVVLGDINHRFNTMNRETKGVVNLANSGSLLMGPRPEGYMYKPNFKIEIRRFSSYIESGDSTTSGIPDYATNVGGSRYIWRDLLPLGFNDGGEADVLDYPFLNGSHYCYSNIFLNVRRQDPFNEYGLYYGEFPRDPFGDRPNTDNFKINSGDNVC